MNKPISSIEEFAGAAQVYLAVLFLEGAINEAQYNERAAGVRQDVEGPL